MEKKRHAPAPDRSVPAIPAGRGKNWPKTVEGLQEVLLAKLDVLRGRLRGDITPAKVVSDEYGDAAPYEVQAQLDAAAQESIRVQIQSIQDAMDRIREQVFGLCTGCGSNIPVARLTAVPETPFCVKCASDPVIRRSKNGESRAYELAADFEDEREDAESA